MAETVFNEGSIDGTDFRVESDTKTHIFFVDGDTNRIGMGLDSPSTFLELQDSGDTYVTLKAGASDGNVGFLFDDSGGNQHGFILFDTDDLNLSLDADNDITLDAGGETIWLKDDGTTIGNIDLGSQNITIRNSVSNMDLIFRGNDGGSEVEAMRINYSGNNVGIGTSSINAKLHVAVDDGTMPTVVGSESALVLQNNSATSDGCTLTIVSGNANNSQICFGDEQDYDAGVFLYSHGSDAFTWRTNGSGEDMRLDSDGDLIIKGTSLASDFGSERGHICISSVDNAGANNYANLLLQGHAIASDVAAGIIAIYDHSTEIVRMQGQRQGSSQGDLIFSTNGDSGITERMRLQYSGNLIMANKTNGLANNIKFVGTATYANNASTVHSLSGSSALVLITNHTNDCGVLAHMDYEHATVTFLANPAGTDATGFNNAASGDTIRVYKNSDSFSFTIKNDTGATKSIGVGIISMHES